MSGNDNLSLQNNSAEKTNENDDDTEEGPEKYRLPISSFSMAHALSMVRRRQQEQQRAQLEQEAILAQERKDKARAKSRRRRQNQKLAKARAQAQEVEAAEGEDEQYVCSDEDTCNRDDMAVDDADDSVPTQSDVIKTFTVVSPDLPATKRMKLSNTATGSESSSVAVPSSEAQNEANSSAKASQDAIKLRSLVPRPIMLKKT